MGQFANKTDNELKEIIDSIATFSVGYVHDYFNELDSRNLLWEMKIFISSSDLISLVSKFEQHPNPNELPKYSVYLDLLQKELKVRGLNEEKEEAETREKNKRTTSFNKIINGIIFIAAMFGFFAIKNNRHKLLNDKSRQNPPAEIRTYSPPSNDRLKNITINKPSIPKLKNPNEEELQKLLKYHKNEKSNLFNRMKPSKQRKNQGIKDFKKSPNSLPRKDLFNTKSPSLKLKNTQDALKNPFQNKSPDLRLKKHK